MNNAVFGKTMENVRKHRNIKLIATERRRSNYLVSEPNYRTTKFFTKDLLTTPHLEANKYLSKIRRSSSCIFSKYYMLTDEKQKIENFLLGRFFLMWA